MSWQIIARAGVGTMNQAWGDEKETKTRPMPQLGGSEKAESFLKSLLKMDEQLPMRETADLTPVQKEIQQMLSGILSKTDQAGDLASGEYRSILEDEYDPRTSPYYEGFRQEAERLQKEGVTSLRQRSELGGMLGSSNAAVSEGSFVSQSNSAILKELGRLLETERGRKLLAAEGIQGAESQRIGNVAAVGGLAEAERNVEQQRNDALYNQVMQQILFPYQYKTGIANTLLNYKPEWETYGGGPSDWTLFSEGFNSGMGPSMTGGMGGGGNQQQGGGGTTVNVSGSSSQNPQATYGAPQGYY